MGGGLVGVDSQRERKRLKRGKTGEGWDVKKVRRKNP